MASSAANRASGLVQLDGSLSTGRWNHTATLLNNRKVLLAAGDGQGTGSFLASADLYDPATGTLTATGSLNLGRDAPVSRSRGGRLYACTKPLYKRF
jgi:hypothetical protein